MICFVFAKIHHQMLASFMALGFSCFTTCGIPNDGGMTWGPMKRLPLAPVFLQEVTNVAHHPRAPTICWTCAAAQRTSERWVCLKQLETSGNLHCQWKNEWNMMKSYEIYIMFPLRYQCSTVEPLDDPRHEALAVRGLMLRIQQQMALVLVDRPTDPRKSGWFYYVDMLFLDVFSKKKPSFFRCWPLPCQFSAQFFDGFWTLCRDLDFWSLRQNLISFVT